jgi:hypothetical protein
MCYKQINDYLEHRLARDIVPRVPKDPTPECPPPESDIIILGVVVDPNGRILMCYRSNDDPTEKVMTWEQMRTLHREEVLGYLEKTLQKPS